MSALSRNVWDTVSNPGVVFSAGGVTNNLTAVTFSNSNGVSFGLNAGVVTASVSVAAGGGSINISAGASSSNVTAVTFSNANGVSWGYDGTNITATVATNYAGTGFTSATTAGTAIVGTLNSNGVSLGVPAYLTTYVNDLTSGRAGTGFTSATTAGVNVVGTLNTNGLSVGVPAYITTYANDLTSGRAGTGFTSATTAGTNVVGTLNTNGLSVGVPAYITTYVNDLTSGRAGTGFTSTSTAGTAMVATLDTNGLSAGIPAYITTYVNDLTSGRAGTGFTSTTTAGTAIVGTLNTSGLSLGVPAYLTTWTVPTVTNSSWTVSDSATSVTVGRLMFSNANGVSFGLITSNNGSQSVTASIATTYAGTGFTTATTAGTAIVGTLNTSGLSMGVPAFITTGVLSSQTMVFSNSQTYYSTGTIAISEGGGAITIATSAGGQSFKFSVPQTSSIVGTNGISISTNGSTISVSNIGPNISAGSTSTNQSNFTFSNGNGITFGIGTGASAGVITASIGTLVNAVNFSAAGSSNNLGSVVFTNANNVSFSLNGSTISGSIATTYAGTGFTTATTAGVAIVGTLNTSGLSMGVPAMLTTAAQSSGMASGWSNFDAVQGTSSFSLQSNSVNVQPFQLPYALSASYLRIPVSFANLTSTTVGATAGSSSFYYYQSINAVIYSQGVGASSRSIQQLTSSFAGFTEAFLFSISNAGTNESIAYQITYPSEGANTANSASTMLTTAGGASIFLHTTGAMTNFTGIHWLDIPMAISLSAGNYWLALNRSTSTTTSGAGINITGNINRAHTLIAVSQINSNFVPLGLASAGGATASTQPVWGIGLGSHSVSAQGATTASLALSSISSVANFPVIPMQFIRQA